MRRADCINAGLQKQFKPLFPERLGDPLTGVMVFAGKNAGIPGGDINLGSKHIECIGDFHRHGVRFQDEHGRGDAIQIHKLIRGQKGFFEAGNIGNVESTAAGDNGFAGFQDPAVNIYFLCIFQDRMTPDDFHPVVAEQSFHSHADIGGHPVFPGYDGL